MASNVSARPSGIIFFPNDDEPTFLKFPKLPFELRTMIMLEEILVPRVITIWRTTKLVKPKVKGGHTVKLPCAGVHISDAYAPSLLHVNQEARKLALKHYQYTFHGRLQRPIYFNFAIDYLHFDNGHAIPVFERPRATLGFGKVDPKSRQKVQRIIIGGPAFHRYERYSWHRSYGGGIKWHIGKYTDLKVVVFETPPEEHTPASLVYRRLERIWKGGRRKWGEDTPKDIVSVSSQILPDMVEAEEYNLETSQGHDEPIVEPITKNRGGGETPQSKKKDAELEFDGS
ncbi:hypothetical protein BKA61DRAFT_231563 [Leptodontidium sp. MPI-SDFR-AT-0119]|nr:hypothetical protein BKA61DRAFT_231563 [Leptodontidium sp. MPI-SDFR-AT-0119]